MSDMEDYDWGLTSDDFNEMIDERILTIEAIVHNANMWLTKNGEEILIKDMTTVHIVNTINMCKRKGLPYPRMLDVELRKRGHSVGLPKKLSWDDM